MNWFVIIGRHSCAGLACRLAGKDVFAITAIRTMALFTVIGMLRAIGLT